MGDFINEKCDLCRTEGVKLFLKGSRCLSNKCPVQHKESLQISMGGPKRRRRRVSEYGIQLREKQKLRKLYGVDEHQFRGYFKKARKVREATGEALMQILELRLDNVVYRLRFAPSRASSRQLVSHGHVVINGKKVDIPSYLVKPGETINLSAVALKIPAVIDSLSEKDVSLPEWLERKAAVGRIKRLPSRSEIDADINEQIVVEYYSR